MIHHDLSLWPLVLSVARGRMTLDDQLAFFAEWTGWLDRGEPFATLRIFNDPDALVRPEGGAKEVKAWLGANHARVKMQVMGMATVVPPEQFEEANRMNAEKLFGVPAHTFSSVGSAVSWISHQVTTAIGTCRTDAAVLFRLDQLRSDPKAD